MYCDDNHIDGNDDDEDELHSRKNQPEFSLLLTHHKFNAKIYHGHCKGNTTVEICAHCQNIIITVAPTHYNMCPSPCPPDSRWGLLITTNKSNTFTQWRSES